MSDGQLWSKDLPLDEFVHRFTVGNDNLLDLHLVHYDLLGSAAHVRMLASVGLLPEQERDAILHGLAELKQIHTRGEFHISPAQEDCHTAIEQALVQFAGTAAGNIHIGRSRNDQVLTALRMYMKLALLQLATEVSTLGTIFAQRAMQLHHIPMPGYTHLRRAMPSAVWQWLLAFSEALLEELDAGQSVLHRLDSCPLGSGAGFGLPLALDREYSAKLLCFQRVQKSPVDCANSRGRHELALLTWISGIGNVLEKFIQDAWLYSSEEFGFLSLPDAFTTGSSIMPQKRNPDVLELARGRCAQLRAWRNEIEQISCGLPSNYHRDYQLLKQPLFAAIQNLGELLVIMQHILPGIVVNEKALGKACTPELRAAQEAYRRMTADGLSFRDSYAQVGREILAGKFSVPADLGPDYLSGPAAMPQIWELMHLLDVQSKWFGNKTESLLNCWDSLLPAV